MMGAVHLLPATTFSNVSAKGSYASEKRATLMLPELELWLRWNAGHQLSAAVSMRRLTDMNEFTHDFRRFAAGTFVRD
jgi:hypothetical protein